MGHPFSKFIPVKSGIPEGFFQKCGKQEVYGDLDIYYNPKLTNYCALKLDSLGGRAYIGLNAYTPTWAQIKAGSCSN